MASEQIPQDQELPREERLRKYLDGYLSVSEKTNAERVAQAEERGREAERRAEQRRKADDFLERERVEELERIKREIARERGKTKDEAQNPAREAVDITTPDIVGTVATPANQNHTARTRRPNASTGLRKKVAGFLAAMSIFGGKGGVEANEIPTQYRGDTTGQNQKSSDNEQTPNSSTYTKVGADFSPANTSPETPSSPENEGPVDIIGEYKLKEGEGFYIGAKKALRDALAKPGVDESIVYAQIVEEYGLDSALLNDPKKLQEIWAKRQGERIEYGIHPNKGGGYRYKITLDPDARFRVYLQDYRSRFAPVVEVTDGMSRHEEKTHETFSVGPENAKKTFHIGQEVTYKTKSGKKGIYSIVGPSLDTNLGLILRELGTNREFAISGDALPRVEEADNKEVSEKEAPLRLETPRVNIQDREEVPVNGVDLNPTPADAPTPEDESGLKPIDTGRPPAMKTYSVNSDFPKSETRVRKEPNSVEEALLGNGTVPENDPARARAMIAWHELDMTLDRVLPDRTAYAEVQKEMLELTTQFLEKDESTQLLTLERIFKTLEQKANAVETAQRAARPRVSLLQRFFDGRRKRDSRAEEYRKVVNSITEEIRIAVDHFDITPPNPDSDVAKTGQ